MLDAQQAIVLTRQFYSLITSSLGPSLLSLKHILTSATTDLDDNTRLLLLLSTLLLALLLAYRLARTAIRMIFGLLFFLLQMAIFVGIMAVLLVHQDTLTEKAREVVERLGI